MYAVIRTGGKQYRVAAGDVIAVEKIGGEAGGSVKFDEVLLIGDDKSQTVGAPVVDGASVAATILEQGLGDKIIVFKKKRRKAYRRTKGHRQHETVVRITDVLPKGAKPAAAKKATPKKTEDKPTETAAADTEPAGAKAAPKKTAAKPAAKTEAKPAAAKPTAKAKADAKPAAKKPAAKAKAATKPAAKKPAAKKPAAAKPKAKSAKDKE